MSFLEEISKYDPKMVLERIEGKTAADVERAVHAERLRIDDFMALLSPAAQDFLEPMAARAHRVTTQRFGRNILLYAPLYLSNECVNGCRYCGFSAKNQVPRRTLGFDEIEREARVLHEQGFRHILLVTGESPKAVDNEFLAAAADRIRPMFSSVSIEVYPMDETGYRQMVAAGVDGLTIYQETYDRALYAEMHPFGKKRDFDFRLATPERGGAAGLRRIGIGSLLGLGNFRSEGFFTGLHALYLSRHYWRTQLSVSFPRIRPADGGFQPLNPVSDRHFVQLICALRLLLPDVGLVLSTRESAKLRDNLIPLGITQMSAGSCTAPGGYADKDHSTRQFAIDDDRTPEEVSRLIRAKGYEAVWKDWDSAFLKA
ncbi:thiamine biosynthesis protein ThiH [Desulfuromonas versatilis]|uniref:Thiamine biosynthesis protein ThiH n=1 Tax=Desulfuromonas versatilis TaxID=2802975 RepID=A0ABM8HSE7_9BACT|nr:2-iminoacetate synthase ThiH [Desulfuromonas versatilis]BCR05951.1 thiamine biosynthesis protein ThiH [Desulfuromonas versatilis]